MPADIQMWASLIEPSRMSKKPRELAYSVIQSFPING